ncbi:MAG: hypothetical protein UX26_C0005G0013 [Parcubacteria group bacterium GW2011_GWC1_45_9]|nr:MAG: hypothetical protein UW85_C0001G0052 [Parcubacteria group bacterium GW2011_GWA1_Parcubacteria_45_10]KKT89285.1 MAG: hypothetical protein UW89_C0001G0013 [Parcubacteria group bacterium GW2011_GWB1_45_10]KKU17217.1 MAG: hypothetical protein UX26_C0005G0013 [Parcubacteria group bacterium GW2011_GWC1_45_9]HCI05496.1 hypothetical protein [Patescibacteria group bacterium]
MVFAFFLLTGVALLALSSFSLAPVLSSGILFFVWFGYGFFRFSFGLLEGLVLLTVFSAFLSLFSGMNLVYSFLFLGLPMAMPLFFVKTFAKFQPRVKTLIGGLVYLNLSFAAAAWLFKVKDFNLYFLAILIFLAVLALEFMAAKILKKKGE